MMTSFVQCVTPLRRTLTVPPRCESGTRTLQIISTSRRWYMSTSDRSDEFSLNSSSDLFSTSGSSSEAAQTMDWDQWSASGEPMTIPAMPFPPAQVFMPGELKQLHLFEARYLALFEAIVVDYDKKCAHVLIDSNRKAMAAFGTTIAVKSWRRLDVGVSVDFEGVGRLKTARMRAPAPFLRGDFQIVEDNPMKDTDFDEACQLEKRFWSAFDEVIEVCIKLGEDPIRKKIDTASLTIQAAESKRRSPGTRQLDSLAGENKMFVLSPEAKKQLFGQKVREAAKRAVNYEDIDFESDDSDEEMKQRRARGLSFAGWDFFPSRPGMRQKAIEEKNTMARLATVVENLEEHSRKLVAKLALQDALSGK